MASTSIYQDIATRTGGDIYIGVVGPVRVGKSTFIRKFMENAVIPHIQDKNDKHRTVDELPQAGGGKTVMTTEPKFIPGEAVALQLENKAAMRIKMIDCVGYVIPDALGQLEDGEERMVRTPWGKEPMPFREAAEIGTRKVMHEHSTIGILVTTDGSICDIPRESYVAAEEAVAKKLQASGKPFAIILNSSHPEKESTTALAYELEQKYNAPVALINCQQLDTEDIGNIMELILEEFPCTQIGVSMPAWMKTLPKDHPLRREVLKSLDAICNGVDKMGDVASAFGEVPANENIASWKATTLSLSDGVATVSVIPQEGLYYRVMSEATGFDIKDDADLLTIMQELAKTKRAYDKVADAMAEVEANGYGIVLPDAGEVSLAEPEIMKQGGKYGVKLHASAQSIHMIRANIESEINPIVGSREQAEELVSSLMEGFAENPEKLWESNIFGKTLFELVSEGMHTKLAHMPNESRKKLSETLEKVINEGSGGLICIIL